LIISILGNGLMARPPKLRAAVGETLEIGYQIAKPKALPIRPFDDIFGRIDNGRAIDPVIICS
jgi:hypothetical protein